VWNQAKHKLCENVDFYQFCFSTTHLRFCCIYCYDDGIKLIKNTERRKRDVLTKII